MDKKTPTFKNVPLERENYIRKEAALFYQLNAHSNSREKHKALVGLVAKVEHLWHFACFVGAEHILVSGRVFGSYEECHIFADEFNEFSKPSEERIALANAILHTNDDIKPN